MARATNDWSKVWALVAVAIVVLVAVGGAILLPGTATGGKLPDIATEPQVVGHALLGAGVILAAAGVIFYGEGYLAGVWLVSTLWPWTAAAGTVVAVFLTDATKAPGIELKIGAVYDGVALALAFVAGVAFLGRVLCRPNRAQPRIWDGLQDRYSQLKARFEQVRDAPRTADDRGTQVATMIAEMEPRFERIEEDLLDLSFAPALRWALATGYSNLQRTLHRIEEMIIASQPDHAVTGDALHDALSLSGSTIADSDTLIIRLRTAMQTISPRSATSFFPARGAPPTPAPDPDTLPTAAEAREVLREVRFAVNDFRDDRVDGIIRARNRLLWVVLTVGITAYFALALGVLCGVDLDTLCVVSALYLVAALAGLINRLRIESSRSSAVEDYGLHLARLIATPLLSGLAGVAGVYLVAATPELLNVVSPTGNGTTPAVLAVNEVFDFATNKSAFLVAAAFGLVPAQLFSGLQRQAERFQVDLEKSAPAGESTQGTGTT